MAFALAFLHLVTVEGLWDGWESREEEEDGLEEGRGGERGGHAEWKEYYYWCLRT